MLAAPFVSLSLFLWPCLQKKAGISSNLSFLQYVIFFCSIGGYRAIIPSFSLSSHLPATYYFIGLRLIRGLLPGNKGFPIFCVAVLKK
jgi:hypothetical protein